MTIHVICFSRSGNTRTVCAEIASRLGVTLHEIRAPDMRPGLWGYLKLGVAALTGGDLRIDAPGVRWAPDDVLVLGAPVWVGRVALPMTAWLKTCPALPSRIALVMTSGQTARPDPSFARFAKAVGTPPVATLHLPEKAVKAGDLDAPVTRFLSELAAAGP